MARVLEAVDTGAVMVCPNSSEAGPPHGACRVGSPYYRDHLGACGRCGATLIEDVDLPRVTQRNALYRIEP